MSSSQTGDAIVRAATVDDVDQMVDLLWSVAAEGRWLGTEVPFDRSARRAGLVTRLGGSDSMVYVADAGDGKSGVYLYDFASGGFFYPSPAFPFPYLYDFSLNTVLYYYPNPSQAGHYNTDGYRFFYDFANGKIITK